MLADGAALDDDAGWLLKVFVAGTEATSASMLSVKRLLLCGENRWALGQLIHLSEQDPPDFAAITELAWLFETGLEVERHPEKAATLLSVVTESGYAIAQNALSVMFV